MEHENGSRPWSISAALNSVATCAMSFLTLIAPCWRLKDSQEELVIPIRYKQSHDRKWKVSRRISVFNEGGMTGEVSLDYGICEGGLPIFEISQARSTAQFIEFDVVYSESREGLEMEQGDGPYFLFSNAMNTYRRETYTFDVAKVPIVLHARHAQQSQRYQKIIIKTPKSAITFSRVGLRQLRRHVPAKCSFTCSDDTLNRIYRDGIRTVELCTLEQNEIPEAWEVTDAGTRVFGQHWAPCRHGTRWGDIIVNFEVLVEQMGASWGIHMVANGLIFCLDLKERAVRIFEGLSHVNSVFPRIDKGSWSLGDEIMEDEWLAVQIVAVGSSVVLKINGYVIGNLDGLDMRPLLGGSGNNTGSIAFGGPAGYTALYRNLCVTDDNGTVLYENDFLPGNKLRTLADFAVGSNFYPCTIDGAKRDRATFAGDLYVMARSIYYSTGRTEAVWGSLSLLTSHQTDEGYLGNLCPVQAPLHNEKDQPPTYAFYSLSYALLLIPTIKEYWLHTGDEKFVRGVWYKLDKLVQFVQRFVDERGLVIAPPPLSMDWFPLGGPIFGASSKINIAYYEALISLSAMSTTFNFANPYTAKAATLKESILKNLYSVDGKSMKMSDVSPHGICQDVNAYAITAGILPADTITEGLASKELPLAFQNIEHLERVKIMSPYTTGFAAEATLVSGNAYRAVEIIKQVWGIMADKSNVNYSGAHWEAMKDDGTPFVHDTSLAHGWSTWPTFLLPKYLGGLRPLEAGWKRWSVSPVLAGLSTIDVSMQTVAGLIKVSLRVKEVDGIGKMTIMIPRKTTCEISAPKGWTLEVETKGGSESKTLVKEGQNKDVVVRMFRDKYKK